MATAHKASIVSARGINDLFARLALRGYIAFAAEVADDVLIQYKSDKHGCTRTVACGSLALLRWLEGNARSYRWQDKFAGILDRKEAWEAPVRQQELNLGEAAPVARRSMRPLD